MTWIQEETDETYPHIHVVMANEETADFLVVEERQQPWLDDDEREYLVRKTPGPHERKVLEELGNYDTLEDAVAKAESFCGREIEVQNHQTE